MKPANPTPSNTGSTRSFQRDTERGIKALRYCEVLQPGGVIPIGNSDHSSLSAVISMAQAVPNLSVSRKVILKHQDNWNTVCGAIQDLPWRNIWLSDNPVEVLNEHLSLLVGRYVPTKVIRVRNKDSPWFDDQCWHAFGLKQEAHLRWTRDRSRVNWDAFISCQVRANRTYLEAKRQFSDRNRAVLMNVRAVLTKVVVHS